MEKNTPKDAGRRRIGRVVVIAVIALAAASIAWWLLVYGRDVLALLTDGRLTVHVPEEQSLETLRCLHAAFLARGEDS